MNSKKMIYFNKIVVYIKIYAFQVEFLNMNKVGAIPTLFFYKIVEINFIIRILEIKIDVVIV